MFVVHTLSSRGAGLLSVGKKVVSFNFAYQGVCQVHPDAGSVID